MRPDATIRRNILSDIGPEPAIARYTHCNGLHRDVIIRQVQMPLVVNVTTEWTEGNRIMVRCLSLGGRILFEKFFDATSDYKVRQLKAEFRLRQEYEGILAPQQQVKFIKGQVVLHANTKVWRKRHLPLRHSAVETVSKRPREYT